MEDVREFLLPDLGEGLDDGEIVAWHVTVGDLVELNQPIVEIETAKAVVSVPSPFVGTVVECVGDVGDVLAVGSVLVRIAVPATGQDPATAAAAPAVEGDAAPSDAPDADAASPSADGAADADHADDDGEEAPRPLVGYGADRAAGRRGARWSGGLDGGAVAQAKPPVRRLAADLGVDLAELAPGSGPDGVITVEDVRAAASAAASPGAAGDDALRWDAPGGGAVELASGGAFRGREAGNVEPIRGIRRTIAEKMETSRGQIPSASCSRDVDLTRIWDLREDLTAHARSQGHDLRFTPFAVLLRATVIALRRFPALNARVEGRDAGRGEAGAIHLLEDINLGFAVDTDRGLMVPNIKRAQAKSLVELAVDLQKLTIAARTGAISPIELTGGTFTVNNYGGFGSDDGEPIINHPEAAILGLGAIRERPWVVDGQLAVRRVATLRLVFDHRVCDGGEAARFVTHVAELCEEPTRMLLHA